MLKEMNQADMMEVNGGTSVIIRVGKTIITELVKAEVINQALNAIKSGADKIHENYMNGYDPNKIVHTRPIHDGMKP